MKITVYRKATPGWRVFREYYWFPINSGLKPIETAAGQVKTRYTCPGCSRNLSADALKIHACLGGTEAWPRLKKAPQFRSLDATSRQMLLEEYQRSNPNVVVDRDNND